MSQSDFDQLVDALLRDGMKLSRLRIATREVVYFKSVIEAYPAIASIHARPGPVTDDVAELVVATTTGLDAEVRAILNELSVETGMTICPFDARLQGEG